jgi:hypothetical protein
MTTKLDEMWAALEAHEPAPKYAEAWRVVCKERTEASAWKASDAALRREAVMAAAWAAMAAEAAAWADEYAQRAIDAIKEVKP